jgi:hypothetical protein
MPHNCMAYYVTGELLIAEISFGGIMDGVE